MAGTRTFSFRAEADLGERHDRALAELERLRRERPRLAESVRYDFDVRLADAQERGLTSPADRMRATVTALVSAVEQAMADEPLMDGEPLRPDDDALAAARAAADAAARRYEDEESGARVIVDAGEVWWFELPRVGRKPGVVCSRRAVNLSLMPVVARITTVARERAIPTVVAVPAGEVEGLAEDCFALAHDLFLAGPAAPPLEPAGRLTATKLVELRRALAWTFSLAD